MSSNGFAASGRSFPEAAKVSVASLSDGVLWSPTLARQEPHGNAHTQSLVQLSVRGLGCFYRTEKVTYGY
jgi:hypothetical protein